MASESGNFHYLAQLQFGANKNQGLNQKLDKRNIVFHTLHTFIKGWDCGGQGAPPHVHPLSRTR